MAGYSPTPLARKLGIVDGSVVVLLDQPDDLELDLPGDAVVKRQLRGQADVVLLFVTSASRLDRHLERLAAAIFPSGGLWVAWPKKSSGARTDVSDHEVRRLSAEHGLVDNKVCAIDETWTALRVVWRRDHRP